MAAFYLVIFAIGKARGPQPADGVEELTFAQPFGSKAKTCYVDGFRKKAYYEVLDIPATVTLSKLGETTESDYTVIGVVDEAFKDDTTLKEVVIPTSVTSIGTDAFSGCTSLEKVTYEGSKSDWEKIDIEDGNEALTKISVEYKK